MISFQKHWVKDKSHALDVSTIALHYSCIAMKSGAAGLFDIHCLTKPNPKFTPLCNVYFNPGDRLSSLATRVRDLYTFTNTIIL